RRLPQMPAPQAVQIDGLTLNDRARQNDLAAPPATRTADALWVPGVGAITRGRDAQAAAPRGRFAVRV
ncbi:MAG TPA: hypothetical protein VGP84_21015, partial [Gemmatimonadaceae bacterium]|nr:hypothetical protein [Gemmatimonadaceae bacterium]